MDDTDTNKTGEPIITIVERRKQRQNDLSSAELMKMIRKRSAMKARKIAETTDVPLFEVDLSNK